MALEDNLTSVWHFNNNGLDAVGSNDATAVGATYDGTTKKLGSHSASLDGIDDHFTVPDSDDWFLGTGDFSVACWVRFDELLDAVTIFGQYQDDNNRWGLDVGPKVSAFQGIRFFVRSGGSTIINQSFPWTTAAIDTWYHVVWIREGNNFRVYLQGSQIGSDGTDTDAIPNMSAPLWMGRFTFSSTRYLKGFLDEMQFWKGKALSAAEVTELWNGGAGIELPVSVGSPKTLMMMGI